MKRPRLFLITAALLLTATVPLRADDPPALTLTLATDGAWDTAWQGVDGFTYFMQWSPDLVHWHYLSMMKADAGTHTFGGPANATTTFIVRLRITDEPTIDPDTDDFDGDGLTNWDEVTAYYTDPLSPDTDGDGMPDKWEIDNQLDPNNAADANADPDLDGLTNRYERYYGTDPHNLDTDGDTLTDGAEVFTHYTDPTSNDTDCDDLSDGEEIAIYRTNPSLWDTDGDTLSDGDEINAVHTDPLLNDADGDWIDDGTEANSLMSHPYLLDPLDPADGLLDFDEDGLKNQLEFVFAAEGFDMNEYNDASTFPWDGDPDGDNLTTQIEFNGTPRTHPKLGDTAADGLPDDWEKLHALDPNSAVGDDGTQGDPDGDGVVNHDEYLNTGDPHAADSDSDGAADGVEVAQASDPNNAADGGQPPVDHVKEVPLQVYGDYASWRMEIHGEGPRDHRTLLVVTPGVGIPATRPLKLLSGNSYKVTLHHTGSLENDLGPWFCWEAHVANWPAVCTFDSYTTGRLPGVAEFTAIADGTWLVDNRSGLFTAHNHRTAARGGNAAQGLESFLRPVGLVPDFNRDGKIDQADRSRVTANKPWRFWNNDDADVGETGGSDIPHETQEDYCDTSIDSVRDLIDYFPVRLEISNVLQVLPKEQFTYRLSYDPVHFMQIPGDEGFRSPFLKVAWNPEATAEAGGETLKSGAWQRELAKAVVLLGKPLHRVNPYAFGGTGTNIEIPVDMLTAAEARNGLIWLSSGLAETTTTRPLSLTVLNADNELVLSLPLHLSISGVEDMFRYIYKLPGAADLTPSDVPGSPPNWPDADRNGEHFVFAHGYNVSGTQARGWGSEFFKRLYWSGSDAMFSAFAWRGNQGQVGPLTPDYQANLVNAFNTGKSLKQYLDLAPGVKTLAAHSMGNILAGAAMTDWNARPCNYFMLDSAAAKECYDAGEAEEASQDTKMVHPAWKDYPKKLRASEWHRLAPTAAWPASDWRAKLTWQNRLSGVTQNGGQTVVYNFYSTGEEVLNNPETNNPVALATNPFNTPTITWTTANKMWAMQEKLKGHGLLGIIFTSTYGGWKANLAPFDASIHTTAQPLPWGSSYRMKTPAELPALDNAFLVARATVPFFDRGAGAALFDQQTGEGSPGSDYAHANRDVLVAEMIPCTSFAAGRNALLNLEMEGKITNIDMDATMKTAPNYWPMSDANGAEPVDGEGNRVPNRPWLHSDIREKAFVHNWKVYAKFVEIGNLNQNANQ